MNLNEFNQKRKRLTKWSQIGLLVVALIAAPLVFLLIQGIVGLAVAGVLGLAVVSFAPAVSMKFANWKLQAIKAEATKNPVETLQNVYNERLAQKSAFKVKITAFRAKTATFADKVESFKERYPQDVDKFEQQLGRMQKLLSRREARYRKVSEDLEKFAGVIQRADAIWQMGLAAAEMNAAAGEFDGEQMYERIKVETALDSVQDSMNLAFSEMDSDLMEGDDLDDQPKQITQQEADVIEVQVKTKERVA